METVAGSIGKTEGERIDGALTGVRVVEFGEYIAGPLAGMLLADQGADVVHVDPPGGPRWDTPANAVWHRGKRRLTLDLHSSTDVALTRRLVEGADVVVENFRPGVMDRLGLGAETVTTTNPGLIYCSIPGFASDDPRADVPGWEGVVTAATGAYAPITLMRSAPEATGQSDPVFSAVPIASAYAAMLAATGIAAALRERLGSGLGQKIEVPLFDSMFVALGIRVLRLPPLPSDFTITSLFGIYECADGRWIFLHTGNKRAEAYLEAIGAADWMNEPDARARAEAIFASRPALAWEELGAEIGTEVAMIRSSEEWLHEPHALESLLVEEVEDSRYGPMLQPGVAVTMSASPGRIRFPARPLNADRDSVLRDLDDGGPWEPSAAATLPKNEESGALSGVKVVDLAIVLAGPTCGRTLAELGAQVIKVEMPVELDNRGVGMPNPASTAQSGSRVDVNRGKYSIVLDLRSKSDQGVLWSLIDDADVLVQNFRRGVIDRLGFGYDALRRRRPDLIYASLNTYGDRGPWRERPGHEQLAQSVSGMSLRYGGDGPPKLQNVGALDDYGTGIMGAYGVILALLERERTGEGQLVTTSLVATAGTLQSAFLYDYDGKQWDEPRGNALGDGVLQRLYRTKDGTWLFLGAGPGEAGRVADAMGLENFDSSDSSLLETRFAEEPSDVWVERLRASGLGAHRVIDVNELMDDPWVRAHGLVTQRVHEGIGDITHAGPAIRMSRSPVQVGRPTPRPDADRDFVLQGLKSTA